MTVLHIYTSGEQYFIIFCCWTAPALNYCKSSDEKNIYFYSKTKQMHNISNLFYFGTILYMFWKVLLASSHRTCMTYTRCCMYRIKTPDDGQKDRPKHVMLFQNKINLRYCASGWFYYRNILWCMVLQNKKNIYIYIYIYIHTYFSNVCELNATSKWCWQCITLNDFVGTVNCMQLF